MGSCCGGTKYDDANSVPLLEQKDYQELAPITEDKEVKRLKKCLGNMLQVILPEIDRLFPEESEKENYKSLITVLDKMISVQLQSIDLGKSTSGGGVVASMKAAERHEILNRACPPDFPLFRGVLKESCTEMAAYESKPRDGRRASHSVHSQLSSATRSQLPRLVQMWFDADEDCSGTLTQSEVKKVLGRMNIDLTNKKLSALIKQVDKSSDGQLQFFEFMTLYEHLTTVEELKPVFQHYAAGSGGGSGATTVQVNASGHGAKKRTGTEGCMSKEKLIQFLMEHQMESEEDAAKIAVKFGSTRVLGGVVGISFKQFQNTLMDGFVNSWKDPVELTTHQDMTQPYTHYFTDCSHNTYLVGHQLTGESSCEMYKRALLNGCRCVELDCWDGNKGDPQVTHGMTMTTKIRFYDVCVAINETAFTNSPYPVMLSLEIHTSMEQQRTMVAMMKDIFGAKLTDAALAESTKEGGPEYSPAALRGRILLKAKRLAGKATKMGLDEVSDGDDDGDASSGPSTPQPPSSPSASGKKEVPPKDAHHAVSQELSDACYTASYKFSTMEEMRKKPHFGVCSIDELRIEKWTKQGRAQYVEFSKRFLLRVYPMGLRCNSSNLNPQLSWNMGVQLIAMNIQTADEGMRLNRGKFQINGQCGMILKPLCMRQQGREQRFNDGLILTVKVLSGHQLPKPKGSKKGEVIDPYVEVFINGFGNDDTSEKRQCTKVVDDNGFNPAWNETFTFTIDAVELATLTFRVMEKDAIGADFIGDNSLPIQSLRSGIRTIPLFVHPDHPEPSPTGLLVQFSTRFKDPKAWVVTDGADDTPLSFRSVSNIPDRTTRDAMRQTESGVMSAAGGDGSPPRPGTHQVDQRANSLAPSSVTAVEEGRSRQQSAPPPSRLDPFDDDIL